MKIIAEDKTITPEVIEMDGYIPFNIEFRAKKSSNYYWRKGNGENSLVELELNNIGEICSISLITINNENVAYTKEPLSLKTIYDGLPVFDMTYWLSESNDYSNRFYDDFGSELKLTIGFNYISLVFVAAGEANLYMKNDRVCFGINMDNELTGIYIIDLLEEEIDRLKSSVDI
jgi:hypothetical protein